MILKSKIKSRRLCIPKDEIFIPRGNIIFASLEDRGIILNTEDKNFYILNKTAVKIWNLLVKKKKIEQIVALFMRQYDAKRKIIVSNVQRVIRELLKLGLIETLSVNNK